MSCADDLTVDDLNNANAAVLERITAGEGSNSNLWAQIDRDNVVGVNVDQVGSAPRVIKTWDERLDEEQYVQSGADDDLIIHIPFINSVRLRTLLLFLPPSTHPHRPNRLRIYANFVDCPSFDELEDVTPIMDLDTSNAPVQRRTLEGRRDVDEWALKVQKLANVHSVTLLFSEAETQLRTKVYYIGFKGDAKQLAMDMTKLGQIPAANAADKTIDGVAEKKGSGYTTIR